MPADDELTRFIDKGEAIALPEDAFGGCIRVVTDPGNDKTPYVRQHLVLPNTLTADETKACVAAVTG